MEKLDLEHLNWPSKNGLDEGLDPLRVQCCHRRQGVILLQSQGNPRLRSETSRSALPTRLSLSLFSLQHSWEMAMDQNPCTPVFTQSASQKDYLGVVTNPKQTTIPFWMSSHHPTGGPTVLLGCILTSNPDTTGRNAKLPNITGPISNKQINWTNQSTNKLNQSNMANQSNQVDNPWARRANGPATKIFAEPPKQSEQNEIMIELYIPIFMHRSLS